MAQARRVGEPISIPEQIDVLEEDGKTIHILHIEVRADVTEFKEKKELLDATWEKMAWALRVEAEELEKKWGGAK